MERYEPYPSLMLAIVAGMLVGLEREHSRPEPTKEPGRGFVGGIRTYPIISLLGAVAALLSRSLGPLPLVTAGIAVGALLALTWARDASAGHLGITTEMSALLTFFLGALALSTGIIEPLPRRIFVVASIAVVTTVLLSSKTQLREFSSRISRDDVIATLKFLLVAVVALPVLPNEPLGPYGVLNPFRIGLMVVLIAGIGFVGYVAMRLLGSGRGLLLTAAIGGLVSSTAVTLASAQRARQTPSLAGVSALSVILASTIMLLRVLVAVFVIERTLFMALLKPMGAMTVVSLALCGVFAWKIDNEGRGATVRSSPELAQAKERRQERAATAVPLTNPFELGSAIKFGAFIMLILLISRWATETFGSSGSYVTGAFAGLADVDAVTLSMANLVKNQEIETLVAERTIVIAIASNTVVKGLVSLAIGGTLMGWRVLLTFVVSLAVGLAVALTIG